jgi:isoleucyl-tRNA synthetase
LNAIIDWDSIRGALPYNTLLENITTHNTQSNFNELLKALNNFLSSSKNTKVIREILYYDNATEEEKKLIDRELDTLQIYSISKKLAQNYYFVINKIYSKLYKSDENVVFPISDMDRYIDIY